MIKISFSKIISISNILKIWKLSHKRQIEIFHKALIMAIINVTSDSFSYGNQHFATQKAVKHALCCLKEGADILDIGCEFTRPGATPITPLEEQKPILHVIKELSHHPQSHYLCLYLSFSNC
ncbi:dihydropteroate synthase [Candidatus Phytoplasma asteris]|uniref:dihydropteroate synthase n=1 Tax=Candidatus Phytoplasma asteris TaxID=85620 RepID=UPI003133880A